MTPPCDPKCPLFGCEDCAYPGGAVPQRDTGVSAGQNGCASVTIGVQETAPERCANTAEGLTASDLTGRAPTMVATPAQPDTPSREVSCAGQV